jgi:uncharacterized protein YjdB
LLLIVTLSGCTEVGAFNPLCGEDCEEPPRPHPPVRSIEIRPDSVALSVGQIVGLTATVTLVDGRTVRNPEVRWSSSDTTVAILHNHSGPRIPTVEVTGRAIGEASIEARYGQDSGWAKAIVK